MALLRLLNRAIEDDRYPLSLRIRTLRHIRAKLSRAPPNPRQRDRRAPADLGVRDMELG